MLPEEIAQIIYEYSVDTITSVIQKALEWKNHPEFDTKEIKIYVNHHDPDEDDVDIDSTGDALVTVSDECGWTTITVTWGHYIYVNGKSTQKYEATFAQEDYYGFNFMNLETGDCLHDLHCENITQFVSKLSEFENYPQEPHFYYQDHDGEKSYSTRLELLALLMSISF